MKLKTISASSYNLYDQCPNCWRLQYKIGLIQPETPALLIGKATHRGIELFHNGKSMDDIIDELKKMVLVDKSDESISNFGMVRKMVELYSMYPVIAENVATEYRFRIPLPNIPAPLYGFIDRVIKGGTVEYKTSSVDYTKKDLENIQADIYSYAYRDKFGELPDITYYVFNKTKLKKSGYKPQILKVKKTNEDMDRLEEKLEIFYDNILNERFVATPENHKFWSPYKEFCK